MASEADVALVRALEATGATTRGLDGIFRAAYLVLAPACGAARRGHGRAVVEDATQNVLREFLEKLRRGSVEATRAPGLLRVMLWRRLCDEVRRTSRLCLDALDLERLPSRAGWR